ncbi:MAG: sigma-70 family RNA polymerase sigma factor [Chloroflexi bacterium]|nr:sigma-70 family RNA polymerase sigma factor [Chloroflexota bacterium]
MNDSDFVQRSKEGDLDAFNRLVESHQAVAYNLALRMLGDRQSAEDATQDAFLSAWRNIGTFRGGSFKAWLLSITANTCRDQLRKRKRNPITSMETLVVEPEGLPSVGSPEDHVLRRELGRQIQEGLATLTSDQRLAVILSDIQGLSYEEIAQVMQCSLGTVRSRLSRGRARLRDYLVRRGTFPPQTSSK